MGNRDRSGVRVDLDAAGADRAALAAQYATSDNLQSRVRVYTYVHDHREVVGSLEGWVLDHVDWPATATVADVGCGPGPYLGELSRRAASVIAVDLSVGMLREVQNRPGTERLVGAVAGDAQRLPLRDQSVDVLLAAHMLYHVPDIGATIGDFRRVIKPGGTLLAPLNGANDKAEIRAVWQEAGAAAVGSGFQVPHWGARVNLDNATAMMSGHFESVTVDRLPGVFRFPTADPPMTWIDSLRRGTETLLAEDGWAAILAETRARIEAVIARDGEFRATKESGVVVAR